jgi:beta-phosphoglucomutase family hydrolase
MIKEKNSYITRPKAFIFDMDGTLVDNMPYHSRAWLELFKSQGFHMEADEFLRCTAGKTNSEILRETVGKHLSEHEIQMLSNQKEECYRKIYRPNLKPAKGLLDFLQKVKAMDIPMAVATAAGSENIRFILGGLNIATFFEAVVGAEDIQKGKPDPEIFFKSAQELHVNPSACIVFEDSPNGVEAARRAGMKAVLITTSHQPEELGDQPALIMAIRDFSTEGLQTVL